jgi:hypothetical protein
MESEDGELEWLHWSQRWTVGRSKGHPGYLVDYQELEFLKTLGYLLPTSERSSSWAKITLTPAGVNAASARYSSFLDTQPDLLQGVKAFHGCVGMETKGDR